MVASFKVKREARAPSHHCPESSQGAFCALSWMPIPSALAGPIPGTASRRVLLHQMTANISFHGLFKLLGESQAAAPQGSFTPERGAFQYCGKAACLQLSIVGQSNLEAISRFVTLLLTGKATLRYETCLEL